MSLQVWQWRTSQSICSTKESYQELFAAFICIWMKRVERDLSILDSGTKVSLTQPRKYLMSPFGKKTPSCPRVTALCAVSLILVKSYKAKNFICTMSVVFWDLEFTHLLSKSMLHSRLLPRNPPIRPWHHDTTRVWDNTTYVYTRSLGALPAPTSSWRPFGPLDFVLHALQALRPCDPRFGDWIVC